MKRTGTSTSSHKIILKPGLGRGGAMIITRRSDTPVIQTPTSYPEEADDVDEDDIHAKREESEGVLDEEEPAIEDQEGAHAGLPRLHLQGSAREGGEGEFDGEEGEEGGRAWRRVGDKVCYIEGDEFVTEPDDKGDQKMDIDGNLLGGRRFKCSTFVLPDRHPTRQYMLAIDAARSSGFRDSLYYFRRNSLALKLSASQQEKEALIQAGKLGAHLKTRSVTLVTARSAYKLHGAKMIIDGRWITDDYYEGRVLADITAKGLSPGDFVGELPDPLAASASNIPAISAPSQTFSGTNQGVYRAGGPTTLFGASGWGPFSDGPHSAVRKSMLTREGLTKDNWMSEAARRIQEMNSEWTKMRQEARTACGGILERNSSSGKGKRKEEVNGAMMWTVKGT
ncbi:chromatin remodelling complex Rsc7/Swp82 subunit-domain-containing protein [Boletus reticuloceps]|uniref:Chromatin remodelling complex Rsc7/Swp82 subunit-domain-containing protein n=1 Tax=Boletus reticuloceps TaxID=495285 RepID=A0A8I2YXZ5_9AGAM|nr:chromatin remodelling complex Rsc7/Swp82 subunit-domain-containing protein [Boletus reticuloceps]